MGVYDWSIPTEKHDSLCGNTKFFFFFILVINLRKEANLMFCHYVENLKKTFYIRKMR